MKEENERRKMEKRFKDTDLREALRRKFSDTPQLPSDFMEKMQERMTQQNEPSVSQPVATKRLWRWVAAAACVLALIGLGVTMLPKDQTGPTKDLYAQTNSTQKTENKPEQDEQYVSMGQTNEKREAVQQSTATPKAAQSVVAEAHVSVKPTTKAVSTTTAEPSTSAKMAVTNLSPKDANLHYATYSTEEDSTYQAPSRMDEFITKIADYNKAKAVPLDCISDKDDSTIANKAYVFQDTKELDLFSRLFQAACCYDSKNPGYLLNFSQQQFFFTLKDLHKGEKYLWIAERIDGGRILLFSSHSPIETNVSSACYQKYREQLTHTFSTSQF